MTKPAAALRAAAPMSASGMMMCGDFPPSSRVTRLRLSTEACRICLPVAVEPVNETLSMAMWPAIAAPAVSPKPVTMLTTPPGSPVSARISPNRNAVSGVCSAGLRITVLPQASAGAIFQTAMVRGPFHGMIPAQTPSGSRTV